MRSVCVTTMVFNKPALDSETVGELAVGDPFALLDNSLGWAWGYAGTDGRVGYIESSALAAS